MPERGGALPPPGWVVNGVWLAEKPVLGEARMHDLLIPTVPSSTAPAGRRRHRERPTSHHGERITGVGQVDGKGRREIADGRLVTPGFVDIHTHYDGQATWDPEVSPRQLARRHHHRDGQLRRRLRAPPPPAKHDWLIQLMEGVEDIPGTALDEGMTWNWETFPEYLDELDAHAPGPRRQRARAPRGRARLRDGRPRRANAEATADEIGAMAKLVREAVEAGAVGFSTTRTLLHRAKDGELAAGTAASADELMGIGRGARRRRRRRVRGGQRHVRPRGRVRLDDRESPRASAVPSRSAACRTTCGPSTGAGSSSRRDRRRRRAPASSPRWRAPACLLLGWDSTAHPFLFHQTWQAIAGCPRGAPGPAPHPEVRTPCWPSGRRRHRRLPHVVVHKLFPLGDPPEYEPRPSGA